MQQIIISGVGGQGVLFVTKLLAEVALRQGCSVLISETHGMAQRGGNVISHLKVDSGGHFSSPLVRPGRADLLLALHPDGLAAHGYYLKAGGKIFCNAGGGEGADGVDASRIAEELGSPVSMNLVLLGFAAGSGGLFCSPESVEEMLELYGGKRKEINLQAFRAGLSEAKERA